jgi:FkbH-like protein
MYEAEVNGSVESIETIPLDVRRRFTELRDEVRLRTVLPWGEHCTECVWPVCYTTCDLYAPRADGACRQFIDGAVRLDHKEGLNPYLIKIRFKQWAKLWTVGTLDLKPLSAANRKESFNIAVGAIGRAVPLPGAIKPRVLQKISYLRRRAAEDAPLPADFPDCFLFECFNPNPRTIHLTFTLRLREQKQARPFQTMISVRPGYNRERVPFSDIQSAVDVAQLFEIEIVPNDADQTVLYFGLMDFVKESAAAAPAKAGEKLLKCIVWDLDNTLWGGTLVEDGPGKIRLRQDVVAVIRELDQRGILHSIASKNNADDALQMLRTFGLEDYFLFPQINWQPKSKSIAQIAQSLNIGVDTLAFVDDQPFEREEVRAALPQVTLIDALEYAGLPHRPECQVPVTAESRNRRAMYREHEKRQAVLEAHQGDYMAFLRACNMEVGITALDERNLQRVYELAQRTNQLNFSGTRYQMEQLHEIMGSKFFETYVIDARDRFGAYGIVGFGVVDTREPRLLDLMFSCRVQSKRVEHAILAFLLKRFAGDSRRHFYANYRKTQKNAPGGMVFEEVGFEAASESEGVTSLVFRSGTVPDDQIVHITYAEPMVNVS